MMLSSVPPVTGWLPYTGFLCLSQSPCKVGSARHRWHTTTTTTNSLYNIWCLVKRLPVTLAVTKSAHMACGIVESMVYRVLSTWLEDPSLLFTGSLVECQQYCDATLSAWSEIAKQYPFQIQIGE